MADRPAYWVRFAVLDFLSGGDGAAATDGAAPIAAVIIAATPGVLQPSRSPACASS